MKGCTCAASSTSLRSGKVIPNTAALRPEATAAMMVFSIMFPQWVVFREGSSGCMQGLILPIDSQHG